MRIYARDDRGERFLRYIECDFCDRRAEPGSKELLEDWRKSGTRTEAGDVTSLDYCPDHAQKHGIP